MCGVYTVQLQSYQHTTTADNNSTACVVCTVHSTVQRSTASGRSGSTEQESLNCFLRRAGLGLGLAGPTTPHHTVLLVTAPWHSVTTLHSPLSSSN